MIKLALIIGVSRTSRWAGWFIPNILYPLQMPWQHLIRGSLSSNLQTRLNSHLSHLLFHLLAMEALHFRTALVDKAREAFSSLYKIMHPSSLKYPRSTGIKTIPKIMKERQMMLQKLRPCNSILYSHLGVSWVDSNILRVCSPLNSLLILLSSIFRWITISTISRARLTRESWWEAINLKSIPSRPQPHLYLGRWLPIFWALRHEQMIRQCYR